MAQGQQFPNANEPIAGPGGKITASWFATLNSLWRKASGGTVTAVTGTAPIASSGGSAPDISLSASGVTAGSYTNANLTVSAKGLITAAANGSAGTGTVTHTAGSLTVNELVVGNAGADLKTVAATNGQVPIGKTSDGSVTLATITPGANITVTNSAGGITIAATAGAGGTGNSIYTTAVGAEPGSPNTGDLDLYSNGMVGSRWSGSAWVPWGPLFPFINPAVSAPTTWVNQGGAAVDSTVGGIALTAPAGSGVNWRLRVGAAPATPYIITAAFLADPLMVNFHQFGLVFRESGSGKLHVFSCQANTGVVGGTYALSSLKYTNPTTYSGSAYSQQPTSNSTFVWFRIADDGANRICSYSADGQHWLVFTTIARTDYLTADQVGFGADVENATYGMATTLLSWAVT